MVTTEPYEGFLTAGMSHSFASDSLVRNLVSPLRSLFFGESEEEDDDELQNSCELRENGLYGQEEEREEVEEAREGNTRTLPKGLSPEQLRVHKLTHCLFTSWCTQCVAGRAKIWQHFRQEVADHGGVPTIFFDYCP